MPNTSSAAKRMKSDTRKREQNQRVLSELKTLTRNLRTLAVQDQKKAAEYARLVAKKFDQAASNGVIPKGRADRKKARIAVLLARK